MQYFSKDIPKKSYGIAFFLPMMHFKNSFLLYSLHYHYCELLSSEIWDFSCPISNYKIVSFQAFHAKNIVSQFFWDHLPEKLQFLPSFYSSLQLTFFHNLFDGKPVFDNS